MRLDKLVVPILMIATLLFSACIPDTATTNQDSHLPLLLQETTLVETVYFSEGVTFRRMPHGQGWRTDTTKPGYTFIETFETEPSDAELFAAFLRNRDIGLNGNDLLLVLIDQVGGTSTVYHVQDGRSLQIRPESSIISQGLESVRILGQDYEAYLMVINVNQVDTVQLGDPSNIVLEQEDPDVGVAIQIRVTTRAANIRTGPNTDYPRLTPEIFGVFGDILDVLARDPHSGWYKVLLADGRIGWISDKVVTPVGMATSLPQAREPAGCELPTIVSFYAGPSVNPQAQFALYYLVIDADMVSVFDNQLPPGANYMDIWHDEPAYWSLWAKKEGTADSCYAEESIFVDPQNIERP